MTDADIVEALAEKVMGLDGPWCSCRWGPLDLGARFCHDCEQKVMPDPLVSDADACAVLDKMVADGWKPSLYVDSPFRWTVEIYNGAVPDDGIMVTEQDGLTPASRRRVICIAALKAVGAWKE